MPSRIRPNGTAKILLETFQKCGMRTINLVDRLQLDKLQGITSLDDSNFGRTSLKPRLINQLVNEGVKIENIIWDRSAKKDIILSLSQVKNLDRLSLLERIGKLRGIRTFYTVAAKELIFLGNERNISLIVLKRKGLPEDIDPLTPEENNGVICTGLGMYREIPEVDFDLPGNFNLSPLPPPTDSGKDPEWAKPPKKPKDK